MTLFCVAWLQRQVLAASGRTPRSQRARKAARAESDARLGQLGEAEVERVLTARGEVVRGRRMRLHGVELDLVSVAPDGRVWINEVKSARYCVVPRPHADPWTGRGELLQRVSWKQRKRLETACRRLARTVGARTGLRLVCVLVRTDGKFFLREFVLREP